MLDEMVKVNDNYTKSGVNIVFAIEATANMVAHYDQVRKNYILPILNHFDMKSTSTSSNELINFSTTTRCYVLVVYYSADSNPGYLTQCYPPVENSQEFLKLIDSQLFTGGAGENFAHVCEGLATSLQAFSDLASQQQPISADIDVKYERFCFLIANSPPYQQSCVENHDYFGLTLQQLGEKFYEKEIKLSIICPRHINQLRMLFVTSTPNITPTTNLLNYAQDRRHLVLISGFSMPTERDPYLLMDEQQETNNMLTTKTEPISIPDHQLPPETHYSPIPGSADGSGVIPSNSLSAMPSSSLLENNLQHGQQPNRNVKIINISSIGTSSNNQDSFKVLRPNCPVSAYSAPKQDLENQPKLIVSTGASSNIPRPPQTNPSPVVVPESSNLDKAREEADKILLFAASKPKNKIIWKGQVEWTERHRQNGFNGGQVRKVPKMTPCAVYQQINNHQPEVSTTNWLPKFTLSFVNNMYMHNLNELLKPKAKLIFNFTNPAIAPSLAEHFHKQYGIVTLFQRPVGEEPKHAFIVCTQNDDKYFFHGFIPHNSSKILQAMRELYDKVQQQQQPTHRYPSQQNQAQSRQLQLQQQQQQQQQQQNNSNGMIQTQNRVVNIGAGGKHQLQQARNPAEMQQQQQQQQHSMQQQSPHNNIQINSAIPSASMTSGQLNPMNTKTLQQHNLQQQQQPNRVGDQQQQQMGRMMNRDPSMTPQQMPQINRQTTSVINSQMQQQQQTQQMYQQQQQHTNMLPNSRLF